MPILATKLYRPPPRSKRVLRPRLVKRLNEGLWQSTSFARKLTLVSAPAGFGKTTLVTEWCNLQKPQIAWLSLDEGDNDSARFLVYFVAALQTIAPNVGAGLLGALESPQPPPMKVILTTLLNAIATIPENFILVLDDYHLIDAQPIDQMLSFLIEHMPAQMHLVIATREDPSLSLSRLRAQGQLTELRAADLRFTPAEAAEFLNEVMGLGLSAQDTAALEERTEGWIAGLQLAALALQGHSSTHKDANASRFIESFTGSHRFVMDYMLDQVLHQQPEPIQTFLFRTSILDRLCGPLCDQVVGTFESWNVKPLAPGDPDQPFNLLTFKRSNELLEFLERANLFIVPLDNERRWYRYHHLFADLLRQRLHQTIAPTVDEAQSRVKELHLRASQWFEDQSLHLEAFRHAAVANDIERAARLIGGDRVPQHMRGAVTTILNWFESLPRSVLDTRPWLWWRYGSLLLVNGHTTGVEEKFQAAEAGLPDTEPDANTRNLIGLIATARAILALTRYDIQGMLAQSRRALEYLDPQTMISRSSAYWTMGYAYILQGDRAAARDALSQAISISQACGDVFTMILATIGIASLDELDNQLHRAAETYRRALQMAGDQPLQIISEAHLGLARVLYEWNDLDTAEQHARQSLDLARQYERGIDRFVISEVFLARLKLARGDLSDAAADLEQVSQTARQKNFTHRLPEVAAAQVETLLRQGSLATAAQLAQAYPIPMGQARVQLAQGDTAAALALLEKLRAQAVTRNWQDEKLKVSLLQAVGYHLLGDNDRAVERLTDVLTIAEPGGFIRIFVDEDAPMRSLLQVYKSQVSSSASLGVYVEKLLKAFGESKPATVQPSNLQSKIAAQPLIEPLSQRELEILTLIARGLSNREISEKLFLALDTVKGRNQKIFAKLHVQRRTEAVARARELGLL